MPNLIFAYNFRHLLARKITTLLTVGGVALVVFIFVATLMLSEGLKNTLVSTGSELNAIVIRQGAQNEVQSGVTQEHKNIIMSRPEVARSSDGFPLATSDVLVLVSLRKRSDGQPSNVNLRGVSAPAFQIREQVKLLAGRLPAKGTQEVIVGSAILRKFAGTEIGSSLRLVGTNWIIVGTFDAGNSAFSSEIWGDVEVLMPAFKRQQFSSITVRLAHGDRFSAFKDGIENDRRLNLAVKLEQQFYADQSRSLSLFIRIIGGFLSVVFAIGAVIGAMITMYSAVASRAREVAILRAIGFSKFSILSAFMKECLMIAVSGGLVGILLASALSPLAISTTNFQSFSEVAFGFRMTAEIFVYGLLFSVLMGMIGGLLPAVSAARRPIISSLRE